MTFLFTFNSIVTVKKNTDSNHFLSRLKTTPVTLLMSRLNKINV